MLKKNNYETVNFSYYETLHKGRTMMILPENNYVCIDVHKKDWQVGQFYARLVLGNQRITGNGQKLIDFLEKRYVGATLKCVYESCAWGSICNENLQLPV